MEPKAAWGGNSPIAQALGDDFQCLHTAVRRHYAERTNDFRGTMDFIYVSNTIRPLALVSYRLLRAPVPHSGRDVEFSLHSWVDDSGTMHWVRTFFKNASFPEAITFPSRMVCSGDHRVIEFTRYGMGGESDLRVDGDGSLVYDMRCYAVRVPYRGLTVRFPPVAIAFWRRPREGNR